jgi:replicative DNA helicase
MKNIDAERSVLAAMMKKGVAGKYISRLTPEDFTNPSHQRLFTAMQALHISKRPIDLPCMSDMTAHLAPAKADEDMIYLMEIMRTCSFAVEYAIEEHIRLVKDCAKRRATYQVFENALRKLSDPNSDVDLVISDAQGKFRKLHEVKSDSDTLQKVLLDAFEALEGRSKGAEKGMLSGVKMLDAKTAGFHKGEMTIIGARPAVGKSALAAQIAIAAAEAGYKVCILSREMTGVQYGIRILARGTKVSNMRMRTGELTDDDWGQLSDSLMLYGNHDIRFMFSTKYIEDLKMEAEAMKETDGLDMLIVDYIQLMQTRQRFDKDYQRIGFISKTLKDLSTELNISVIALAQVGRSTDGSMPMLSELRGSGDLEQDADNVIFIHRPEDAQDKWVRPSDRGIFDALRSMKCQYLVLNVAKQRQGETGAAACIFDPRAMSFTEVKREG